MKNTDWDKSKRLLAGTVFARLKITMKKKKVLLFEDKRKILCKELAKL